MTLYLFTTSPSLQKFWKKSIDNQTIIVEELETLENYLKETTQQVLILVDENSCLDIEEFFLKMELYPFVNIALFHKKPTLQHALNLLNKAQLKGYENSYLAPVNLQQMIATIQDGNKWFFKELTLYMVNHYSERKDSFNKEILSLLTTREQQIAILVAQGLSNKEIAQKLTLSLPTVKVHVKHIFEKLEISDRVALVLKVRV